MFKNYLKIALRNIRRHKGYSFINIAGLAVGMACCMLILLYVRYELSYDTYHANADRIYRVAERLHWYGKDTHKAVTQAPLALALETDFPEVIHAVRLMDLRGWGDKVLVAHEEKSFYEEKWLYADASVFDIFTFPLIKGNSKTALIHPFSVVVTESIAKKYFGEDDPTGQSFLIDDEHHFTITGVVKDVPENAHFRFDFLASFSTVERWRGKWLNNWYNHMYYTYVLLDENCKAHELESRFPDFIRNHTGVREEVRIEYHLQSLTDIHLHSKLEGEIEPNGDIVYIYIFASIAVFILLIACINFMNLATARAVSRAREVGIRKVVGAYRSQLVKQFLGESVLFVLLALPVAIVLAELILPAYNALTEKSMGFYLFDHWSVILFFIVVTLFVGVLAGIYPALFLSGFKPIRVFKGRGSDRGRSWLRKGLIIFQFIISIALIVSTLIVKKQMHYMRAKKLGFDKEQIVVLPTMRDQRLRNLYGTMKHELLKYPKIRNVSASSGLPGRITHHWVFDAKGEGEAGERQSAWIMMVDHDFVKTLGIEVVEGRDFSKSHATDEKEAILLNESAKETFGWDSPIGKNIKTENKEGVVIGVVKDFHFQSLYQRIEPLVMYIYPRYNYFAVRLAPDDIPASMAFIKTRWQELVPDRPFEYYFLDNDFDSLYRAEERVGEIFEYFAVLSIFISCLGLFGLVSFSAERRTKEIGIRKVLGASVPNIILLISREFVKLVLIANMIAWPAAFFVMRRWLQNFAYRTDFGVWMFFLSAVLALGIALMTVSYQSIRAALANPVDALRYE